MAEETIGLVVKVAETIYGLVQEVEYFKHCSQRLVDRIKNLLSIIETITGSEHGDVFRPEASAAGGGLFLQSLQDLMLLLEGIKDLVESLDANSFPSMNLKRSLIGRRFDEYSEELDAVSKACCIGRTAQMGEGIHRLEEDAKDREDDVRETREKLSKLTKGQGGLKGKLEDVLKSLKESSTKDQKAVYKHHCAKEGLKEIGCSQLLAKKEISTGRFGRTYKAVYLMERVVLKSLSIGDECPDIKCVLLKEAKELLYLDSTYVVRVWGVCTENVPYLVVLEYMARGSLRHVLDAEGNNLSWERRVQMALDGALGLHRIHHMPRPLLPLDIDSDRFLVGENWNVKISGVGFSETQFSISKSETAKRPSKSSRSYDSPERLENTSHCSDASTDIYSYGIVMWEIATGLKPYEGYSDDDIVNLVVHNKGKLSLALYQECPSGFKEAIDRCRDFDPITRPTSSGIVNQLQKLRSSTDVM